jgi:hypothetical protein
MRREKHKIPKSVSLIFFAKAEILLDTADLSLVKQINLKRRLSSKSAAPPTADVAGAVAPVRNVALGPDMDPWLYRTVRVGPADLSYIKAELLGA